VTRSHVVNGWRIDVTVRAGARRLLAGSEVARVVAAGLSLAGAPTPASLSVVLADDAEIAELNETHMGEGGPTDVLSFPLLPPGAFPGHDGEPADRRERTAASAPPFVLPPRARVHLGDIVVSVERAIAQAGAGRGGQTGDVRWSPSQELRLLLTHGALHICGWDHAERREEAAMRQLERELLGAVPD
jgi:probable rRNA maturation factor